MVDHLGRRHWQRRWVAVAGTGQVLGRRRWPQVVRTKDRRHSVAVRVVVGNRVPTHNQTFRVCGVHWTAFVTELVMVVAVPVHDPVVLDIPTLTSISTSISSISWPTRKLRVRRSCCRGRWNPAVPPPLLFTVVWVTLILFATRLFLFLVAVSPTGGGAVVGCRASVRIAVQIQHQRCVCVATINIWF